MKKIFLIIAIFTTIPAFAQEQKQYIVNEEVLKQTLNYLAQRPYIEVFKIIPTLQNSNIYVNPVYESKEETKKVDE